MGRKSSFLFIAGVAILMLVSGRCMGQQDTTGKRNDSLNAAIIANYTGRLIEIEKQRVQDSVRKTELEARLNALSTTDNLKKEELQRQLQELRDADGNRLLNKIKQIDSLRLTAVGYPVTGFFNDTLFTIFSGLGSFSARERADVISTRVKRIAGGYRYKKDTLSLTETESTVDISYGETIIMSVTESDALWGNGTRKEVAQRFLERINNAEKTYISETGLVMLIKEVGLALLVIALVGVLMFYLRKLFRWTAQKIRDQENKRINGIKIRTYVLFDARRQINALLNLNTVVFWAVIIIVVYVSLPILFGIFPWTKHFADTLFGYILTPFRKIVLSIWNFIPNIITIAVIVFVFRYVLKLIRFLKTEIEHGKLHLPGFYPDWANPTYQIVRVIVFSFMVIVIFPYLPGSNSPVFQGVSVFLGFLFTFGSAGSLSNVVAGLVLTYMRLFKLGDRVKIGEVVGDVIEKSLLVTRIRTIKNEIISIPNTTVMNSHAINYSSDAPDRGLIIHTTVTIGYDVPWKQIHQALIDAALRTKLVLTDPAPFVLQTSLDDFYVSYQINAYTREPNRQATIYSDLHQHIQDVCNEVGIEILSPHYRAARDGNATTIPHDYLPEDYKAPGFNVHVKKDKE